MALTLIGQKCGMTRVFEESGNSIPVSVIEVMPNRIVFTKESPEGFVVQLTAGEVHQNKVTKPLAGHFKKHQVKPGKIVHEVKFESNDPEKEMFKTNSEITVSALKEGDSVKVAGMSKGKGFSGVIKRYHFASQDATHGNSLSHNAPGSIGQRQTPGRVFKGKRMAGRLGNERVTIKGLKIVKIIPEKNLVLVLGAIPGATGQTVYITRTKSSE